MKQYPVGPADSVSDNFGAESATGSPVLQATPMPIIQVAPQRGMWDFVTLGLAAAGAYFGWTAWKASQGRARGGKRAKR